MEFLTASANCRRKPTAAATAWVDEESFMFRSTSVQELEDWDENLRFVADVDCSDPKPGINRRVEGIYLYFLAVECLGFNTGYLGWPCRCCNIPTMRLNMLQYPHNASIYELSSWWFHELSRFTLQLWFKQCVSLTCIAVNIFTTQYRCCAIGGLDRP